MRTRSTLCYARDLMAGSVPPARGAGLRLRPAGRVGALTWLVVAGLLLAALAWLDRDQLPALGVQFAAADWRYAVLGLGLLISVELAKALRWQVLYGRLRPPYRRVLQAQVVGQAANTLIPLRIGDFVRVSWAAPNPSGLVRGTAGLVLTKAVDALVLAGLIAWVFGGSLVAQAQLMPVVVLGLLIAVGLGLAQRYHYHGQGGPQALAHMLAAAARYARELGPQILLVVLLTSAFAWLVGGLANLAVLRAVGAPPAIDPAARILVSGYVAGLLPAPPGRLGVYEGAVVAALVAGGVELPTAIASAVLLHALQLVELGLLALPATRWR